MQVLRKADIIRKNTVESVQAERNILITVRNPFVVCIHSNELNKLFKFSGSFPRLYSRLCSDNFSCWSLGVILGYVARFDSFTHLPAVITFIL